MQLNEHPYELNTKSITSAIKVHWISTCVFTQTLLRRIVNNM